VLTISQKCFFGSLDELALFVEPDIKESMIACAFAGWANARFPPWKLGSKYFPKKLIQIFPEETEVGISNFD